MVPYNEPGAALTGTAAVASSTRGGRPAKGGSSTARPAGRHAATAGKPSLGKMTKYASIARGYIFLSFFQQSTGIPHPPLSPYPALPCCCAASHSRPHLLIPSCRAGSRSPLSRVREPTPQQTALRTLHGLITIQLEQALVSPLHCSVSLSLTHTLSHAHSLMRFH